tara:strand:- start:407 stop:1501 length:1095 start_codon:yes stop_codon:yes gene_type:complete
MALTKISTDGFKDDAVTTDKLANAINTERTANTAKVSLDADSVTGAKIADNAIDSEHYTDGSIDTAHIADGAVSTAKLATDAVTSAKIADNAVVTARINDAAVTNAKLADDSVNVSKIANDAVTTAKIADGTISTAKYSNGSITSIKIANDAVTGAKIGDDAVATANIGDSQVTTAKISDGAITQAKLASGVGGGGIVKIATRRYYGFDQTTGIGNSGFTRMDKAFVTITPSSASNYIKLGGVMNWSGSDTEGVYSFRWRREISGGATTSLDSSQASGTQPAIQFRLLGNGDVATLPLHGVIDYPNTTSAVTYYIEVFVDGANQSVYLNRSQTHSNDPRHEIGTSYFIAEELDNSVHTHTNTNS